MHPRFIVFEGLDGSGQSTQAKLLQEFLELKKIKVMLTKEPNYSSSIGKLIKKVLQQKGEISKEALQLLFVADRFQNVDKIKKALNEGKWVISDRYFFSTLAFGSSIGIDYNWLKELNKYFPKPDVVFYLDTMPETCIRRISKRKGKNELFEETEKLKKVKEQYNIILNDRDYKSIFYIVNGEEEIFEVHKIISEYVNKNYIL